MLKLRFGLCLLAAMVAAGSGVGFAQQKALGSFDGSTDVGAVKPGATAYDAARETYRVTGGGADMWGTADGLHLSWVRLAGDATVTADHFTPNGGALPADRLVTRFTVTAFSPALGLEGARKAAQLMQAAGASSVTRPKDSKAPDL